MDTESDTKLENIISIAEEIIGVENIKSLLDHKENIIAYDGFEPSGRLHKTITINNQT